MRKRPCPNCGKQMVRIKRYSNELTKGIILSRIYPVIIYPCCNKAWVPKEMIEEDRQLKEAKILV